MEAFERGSITLPPVKEFIQSQMDDFGMTRKAAKYSYNKLREDEIWVNDLYQVNIDRDPPHNLDFPVIHLSIKRRDKAPIHDWRDLQEIKNLLVGEEVEAIELYPAESRVVDLANQYHLWAFPEGQKMPVGWTTRAVCNESKGGAVQRPREES